MSGGDKQLEHEARTGVGERALYLLSLYLWEEIGVYSKRIDEKRSSNKHRPNGNRWLYSGVVRMEDLGADWLPEPEITARSSREIRGLSRSASPISRSPRNRDSRNCCSRESREPLIGINSFMRSSQHRPYQGMFSGLRGFLLCPVPQFLLPGNPNEDAERNRDERKKIGHSIHGYPSMRMAHLILRHQAVRTRIRLSPRGFEHRSTRILGENRLAMGAKSLIQPKYLKAQIIPTIATIRTTVWAIRVL